VDVARPHAEPLEQDHVQELDDGGLVRDVEDVLGDLDLRREAADLVLVHVRQGLVHRVLLPLVGAVDEVRDLRARSQDGLHVEPEHRGEVVHRVRLERRAGRHREGPVVLAHGHEVEVPREVDRHPVHEVGGHGGPLQALAERDAERRAERGEGVPLRHVALVDEDLVERLAGLRLQAQTLLEALLVEELLLEDDLLEYLSHFPSSPFFVFSFERSRNRFHASSAFISARGRVL
jgi:hypothetical protein